MNNDRYPTYLEALEQIEILEKALELACENSAFEDTCDFCKYTKEVGCPCFCETDQNFSRDMAIDYFKAKAKEIMKSE